jgi:hypothetical protein
MAPTPTPTLSQVDQDYTAVQALEATYNGSLGQAPALAQATANAEAALATAQAAQAANATQIAANGAALAAGYVTLATDADAAAVALAPAPPASPAQVPAS